MGPRERVRESRVSEDIKVFETFRIVDDDHNIGDKECPACRGLEYPSECSNCEDGLYHCSYVDEHGIDNPIYAWECDNCGYDRPPE